MKQRPDGTIDFANLDQGVADTIRSGQHRQQRRGMSKEQRKQAARARATYDLPVELIQHIKTLALEIGAPESQVARWMLLRGLEATQRDELENAKTPSRSMRYEFNLFPDRGDTKGRH